MVAATDVELVSLPPSPWTVKAKWALDHNGVKYKCTKYTPILGEGWLRRKTGKKEGLLTTPVLVCPEGVLMDSFDIAQWADIHRQNTGASKLFPDGQLETIAKWNRACDDVLEYYRAEFTKKMQSDKAARRQLMPPVINSLGPITDWLGSMMFKPMIAKYDEISRASSVAKAKKVLEELREVLKTNNGYVLGAFSYADITMAVACNVIDPIGPPISKQPEAMRQPNPELKAEFGDLVAYRDKIYNEHFPSTE